MRYRSLGRTGPSVSAITLAPPPGVLDQAAAYRLLCAALELGINSFQIAEDDVAAAAALGEMVGSVGRRLLVLTLAATRGDVDALRLREVLRASRAERFDVVLLDGEDATGLSERAERLRRERLARLVGVGGGEAGLDRAIAGGGLDVMATSYNLCTGWPERNRIKTALAKGLSVIGGDFEVGVQDAVQAQGHAPKGLTRLFQRRAVREAQHAYGFLRSTAGWTSAQVCLAYALTEPALATVLTQTAAHDVLRQLAEAVERELPSGVAAQIEIARFAALPQAGAA